MWIVFYKEYKEHMFLKNVLESNLFRIKSKLIYYTMNSKMYIFKLKVLYYLQNEKKIEL